MFDRVTIPFALHFITHRNVEATPRHAVVVNWVQPISLTILALGLLLTTATVSLALLVPDLVRELSTLEVSSTLNARFFRLGRVAAMALPLLTLLALPALCRRRRAVWNRRLAAFAQSGFAVGVIAMPMVLFASAFVSPHLKYFLAIPAVAVTFASASVAWLSVNNRTSRGETAAWVSLTCSLAFGLLLGMFAFDGPLPVPSIVDGYNDAIRVWLRGLHHVSITAALVRLTWSRCFSRASAVARTRLFAPGESARE